MAEPLTPTALIRMLGDTIAPLVTATPDGDGVHIHVVSPGALLTSGQLVAAINATDGARIEKTYAINPPVFRVVRDTRRVTALDRHAARLASTLAAIAADPTGPIACTVRDDLRRAHQVGVQRNLTAVTQLVRALPTDLRAGLLSDRCRAAYTYRRILAAR